MMMKIWFAKESLYLPSSGQQICNTIYIPTSHYSSIRAIEREKKTTINFVAATLKISQVVIKSHKSKTDRQYNG